MHIEINLWNSEIPLPYNWQVMLTKRVESVLACQALFSADVCPDSTCSCWQGFGGSVIVMLSVPELQMVLQLMHC